MEKCKQILRPGNQDQSAVADITTNPPGGSIAILTYEQVQRLVNVMKQSFYIHGTGNFPTIALNLQQLIREVTNRVKDAGLPIVSVKINGSLASHILASKNFPYSDVDLIFNVELGSTRSRFDVIKQAVLESLLDFLPRDVNRDRLSQSDMKEAYVRKMVKVIDRDIWSLIALNNDRGRFIELKFVDQMRRQFEFSVDSFQINLDSLMTFFDSAPATCSTHRPSHSFPETCRSTASSLYGASYRGLSRTSGKDSLMSSSMSLRSGSRCAGSCDSSRSPSVSRAPCDESASPDNGFATDSGCGESDNPEDSDVELEEPRTVAKGRTSAKGGLDRTSASCCSVADRIPRVGLSGSTPRSRTMPSSHLLSSSSENIPESHISDDEESYSVIEETGAAGHKGTEQLSIIDAGCVHSLLGCQQNHQHQKLPCAVFRTVVRMTPDFYPSVTAECLYGDFVVALRHLNERLIDTIQPEEIRGGGLLKYCNLLVRGFTPARPYRLCTLEKYMCCRFFIDFPQVSSQQQKLSSYLDNHLFGDSAMKYEYLVVFNRVICEASIFPMIHERRDTLEMIEMLAFKVLQELNSATTSVAAAATASVKSAYMQASLSQNIQGLSSLSMYPFNQTALPANPVSMTLHGALPLLVLPMPLYQPHTPLLPMEAKQPSPLVRPLIERNRMSFSDRAGSQRILRSSIGPRLAKRL